LGLVNENLNDGKNSSIAIIKNKNFQEDNKEIIAIESKNNQMDIVKTTKSKQKSSNIKQMKNASERKSENGRYAFTNIYRNLILDRKACEESEILKETEFSLAKEINQLDAALPDLKDFHVIEKENNQAIRRRKVTNIYYYCLLPIADCLLIIS